MVDERGGEAECLRTIVGPGAGRDVAVTSGKAVRRNHLDFVERGDFCGRVEFVGHADGIADEQAPEATFDLFK